MSAGARDHLIEAHRGNSSEYPENTFSAFRSAVDLGARWIELDIHSTADGVFVVMHDETVDRTTPGKGRIAEMHSDQVLGLDAGSWKGPQFAGERVPRLEDVLRFAADTGVRLNIEVKRFGCCHGRAADLADLLAKIPPRTSDPHLVSSFNLEALKELRGVAPDVPLALLGSNGETFGLAIEEGFPWANVEVKAVTPETVACAHAHGVCVMMWTLDDHQLLRHYVEIGVDKICTNRPRTFLEAVRCSPGT